MKQLYLNSILFGLCLFINFVATANDGFDQHRPDDVDDKKWSSLKAAVQEAKLLPESAGIGGVYSEFGASVSVDGNRVLVGAPGMVGSGAAVVLSYDGNNWQEEAVLIPDDGEDGDNFGGSVSLSGDRALVGAYLDDNNGYYTGSVYLFDFNGNSWAQSHMLTADDGAAYDYFGRSVSLSGDRALIGAQGNDDIGNESGSAYVMALPIQYNVNVNVTGLEGGVISFSNGLDTLNMSSDGTQTISTLDDGSAFDVDITTQPSSPNQVCSFDNADSGTLNGADYTVHVSCVTTQYNVNVNVSGLAGGAVSFSNGSDTLNMSSDGTQTISTLDDGSAFDVDITAQPTTPTQICAFVNADAGVLNGTDYVVNVECGFEQYSITGTISGLAPDNFATLSMNNGQEYLTLDSNGPFAFQNQVENGASYAVTVLSQPTTPGQTCVVTGGDNGDGSGVASGNNEHIIVTCDINQFSVGGEVTGLAVGNEVVLQNNGADNHMVAFNGSFAFPSLLNDESQYSVTVLTHPSSPNQQCSVTNGSGYIMNANITNIDVSCETVQYFVGGYLVGLIPDNRIGLQLNGSNELILNADGAFAFNNPIDDGSQYEVTISADASNPIQPCDVVVNGTGSINGEDIDNVFINCEFGDDLIYRHGFDTPEAISRALWEPEE